MQNIIDDEIKYPEDHHPAFDSIEEEQDELYALQDYDSDEDKIYLGNWDGEDIWRDKTAAEKLSELF